MMKTWCCFALAVTAVILVGGCLFNTYHETAHFDLDQTFPIESAPAVSLAVMEFDNWSGAGRRMRVRKDRYRIIDDEYSRWTQPPNVMLSRFLANCFPAVSGRESPSYRLGGRLTAFEAELDTGTFVVRGRYSVRAEDGQTERTRDFAIVEPFAEPSPAAFAAAASRCAAELAKMIAADLAEPDGVGGTPPQ